MKKDNICLTLNFKGLTEAQAITLVKMAKIMEYCGQIGASRTVSFFADGDGDFCPKVDYTTSDPLRFTEKKLVLDLEIMQAMENGSNFKLDYDDTAWQLDHDTNCNMKKEAEQIYDELAATHKILM
jgi:hypothetical protein